MCFLRLRLTDTAQPRQGCVKPFVRRVRHSHFFPAMSFSLSSASQSFGNLCKRGLIAALIRFLRRSNWKIFKGVQSFMKTSLLDAMESLSCIPIQCVSLGVDNHLSKADAQCSSIAKCASGQMDNGHGSHS